MRRARSAIRRRDAARDSAYRRTRAHRRATLWGAPFGPLVLCFPALAFAQTPTATPPAAATFADDFDRAMLGPDWTIDSGSYEIVADQLVENSNDPSTNARLRYAAGSTLGVDQYAKLQVISPGSRSFGFMFRVGDANGHYQVQLAQGTAQWRWERYDPDFVESVGNCTGDAPVAAGNWLGARVDGVGANTAVSVWRWNADPGEPAIWGLPDCQMFQDPPTAVDAGTGLGIRSFTGNPTTPGVVDNWSAGDSTVPVDDFAPQVQLILDSNGAGTPNSMRNPDGVVLDSQDNLYVAACGSRTSEPGVFKIAPNLQVTQVMGAAGDGIHAADCPVGLDVDSLDNVYVAAFSSDNVFRITPGGAVTQLMDASGAGTPNSLTGPIDVALDSAGNLFVSASTSDRVFKRTPGGVITELLGPAGDGSTPLVQPFGLAVDSGDNLLVPGFGIGSDAVFQVSPEGAVAVILDASGDGLGNTLDGPHAVAVDGDDNVFVTGNASDNVFKVTPGGQVSVILDSTGDGEGNPLDNPTGIATDLVGNVYVTAFDSENLFRVTPLGAVAELMDATGDGVAPFLNPANTGIAVDANQSVYAAGTGSDAVFRIQTLPGVTPTPTPSATPSATPIPTPTATPTATPIPTPTAAPTATPTATPTPEPGAILQLVVGGVGLILLGRRRPRVDGLRPKPRSPTCAAR